MFSFSCCSSLSAMVDCTCFLFYMCVLIFLNKFGEIWPFLSDFSLPPVGDSCCTRVDVLDLAGLQALFSVSSACFPEWIISVNLSSNPQTLSSATLRLFFIPSNKYFLTSVWFSTLECFFKFPFFFVISAYFLKISIYFFVFVIFTFSALSWIYVVPCTYL